MLHIKMIFKTFKTKYILYTLILEIITLTIISWVISNQETELINDNTNSRGLQCSMLSW